MDTNKTNEELLADLEKISGRIASMADELTDLYRQRGALIKELFLQRKVKVSALVQATGLGRQRIYQEIEKGKTA